MHAVQIANAATGRDTLLRIEGGWHGVQPWTLGGSAFDSAAERLRQTAPPLGVPDSFQSSVVTIPFNDLNAARSVFDMYGDRLSACIVELVLGNSGMIMAEPEFVQGLRELCTASGTLMIVDELVTGFRVRAGGLQDLFGVRADLSGY